MMYLLQNNEHGMFVAPPGSAKSYTKDPLKARRFPSLEAAKADACGNERPVSLQALVGDL